MSQNVPKDAHESEPVADGEADHKSAAPEDTDEKSKASKGGQERRSDRIRVITSLVETARLLWDIANKFKW